MDNNRFSIDVGGDMLPALIEALSLASTTAMMHFSEKQRLAIKKNFDDLADGLLRQMGVEDVYKINTYQWFGAYRALKTAGEYFFFHELPWRPWDKRDEPNHDPRKVSVIIDGKSFEIFEHRDVKPDAPEIAAAETFLERACGMTTTRTENVESNSSYADWLKYKTERAARG